MKETIEEFLARGGKGETLPYVEPEGRSVFAKMRVKSPLPVHLMSLDEGRHFFSEKQKRRTKKEINGIYSGINMDLIPSELKELLGIE